MGSQLLTGYSEKYGWSQLWGHEHVLHWDGCTSMHPQPSYQKYTSHQHPSDLSNKAACSEGGKLLRPLLSVHIITLCNTVNVWKKRGLERTAFHFAKSSIKISGIRQTSRFNKKLPAFCWLRKRPCETLSSELDDEQHTTQSAYNEVVCSVQPTVNKSNDISQLSQKTDKSSLSWQLKGGLREFWSFYFKKKWKQTGSFKYWLINVQFLNRMINYLVVSV